MIRDTGVAPMDPEGRLRTLLRVFTGWRVSHYLRSPGDTHQNQIRRLICCVSHLFDFETLCLADQARTAAVMDFYYKRIAESVLQTGGDVDRFAGEKIFSFYQVGDDTIGDPSFEHSVVSRLEKARISVEDTMGVRVGLALCTGELIYGRFGSTQRATFAGFGPPLICAGRLAQSMNGTIICARLAGDREMSVWRFGDSFALGQHSCGR